MATSATRTTSACVGTLLAIMPASIGAAAAPASLHSVTTQRLPALAEFPLSGSAVERSQARTFAPSTLVAAGDDYPYKDPYPMDVADPWNFFTRECTSFVAWRMRQFGTKFTNTMLGGRWGDAWQWTLNHPGGMVIFIKDTKPRVKSIAWWGQSDSHPSGHVAIVTKINSNGSTLVEDYNSDKDSTGHYRAPYIANPPPEAFIHPIFVSPEKAWTRNSSGQDQDQFVRAEAIQYTVQMRNLAGLTVKGELRFTAKDTVSGKAIFDWKTSVGVPGEAKTGVPDDPIRHDQGYYVATSIPVRADPGSYRLDVCFKHSLPGLPNPCAHGYFTVVR